MIRVDPVTLEFNGVRLEPLALHHREGLVSAALDGELWNLRVTSVPAPHETEDYIRTALETGNRQAFAVVDVPTGSVIGSTSYHDIVPGVDRVEIGYTWYAQSRQRSHVNTSCKDGVIRHHALRRDGTVRDTVMYSILRGEWPEIKSQLHYRLSRHSEN
jgi:RimJ/RimL family protein N-acetyltransferase